MSPKITFAQSRAHSVANSRSQVQVAGGAPGAKEPTAAAADTAGRGAARRAPVPRALVLASVALLLILFVASLALSVRAYVYSLRGLTARPRM